MDPLKDIEHYAQVMKAPRIRESAARLAEQARSDGWSHEDYLPRRAVARGHGEGIRPALRTGSIGRIFDTKIVGGFNFDYQPSLSRGMVAYLGTGVSLT